MKHYFECKMNLRCWISFVLLILITGILMVCFPRILFTDSEDSTVKVLGIMMCVILPVYLYSTLMALMQVIAYKAKAVQLTEEGIEHAFIMGMVTRMFLIWTPVRLIPWSAVKDVLHKDESLFLKLDVDKVQANKLAKMLLKLNEGFPLGRYAGGKELTVEELKQYISVKY